MQKRIKNSITILLLLLLGGSLAAQPNTEEQLAFQYYQNGEFEKAAGLYEGLFNKKGGAFYYNYYLDCLLELEDYRKAEKFLDKLIKKEPANQKYGVDLGYILERSGDAAAAKKQYEQMIRSLKADATMVADLANAFSLRNKTDWMLETYRKGRELLKTGYGFHLEIAALHTAKGDFENALNEYLNLLDQNQGYTDQVHARLQDLLLTDTLKSETFKSILLARIKKFPERAHYTELLYWFFVQVKDFDAALIQAKSLDRRQSENGSRIMDLAMLAVSNQNYEVAIQCYDYIIEKKGQDSPYYYTCRFEKVNVRYLQLISSPVAERQTAEILEKDYRQIISEMGMSGVAVPYIRNLASVQAQYLQKPDSAIALLQRAITLPGTTPENIAYCKLDLADILLMTGDVWEASLLYSQVEKAFKNDITGYDAKYRNAKLYYYIGEFEYARTQLDILKAATSKLISNDAIALSLLIAENFDSDSSMAGLRLYARADLLNYQKQYPLALATLDSIAMLELWHPLLDEALYMKAGIMIKTGNYSEADTLLTQLLNLHGEDILADDALYTLAQLNENVFRNRTRAMELYARMLSDYPGSVYVVESRKRYRMLRGELP